MEINEGKGPVKAFYNPLPVDQASMYLHLHHRAAKRREEKQPLNRGCLTYFGHSTFFTNYSKRNKLSMMEHKFGGEEMKSLCVNDDYHDRMELSTGID